MAEYKVFCDCGEGEYWCVKRCLMPWPEDDDEDDTRMDEQQPLGSSATRADQIADSNVMREDIEK
jgi:hypothetical protein